MPNKAERARTWSSGCCSSVQPASVAFANGSGTYVEDEEDSGVVVHPRAFAAYLDRTLVLSPQLRAARQPYAATFAWRLQLSFSARQRLRNVGAYLW